jgi:hypothetical protein
MSAMTALQVVMMRNISLFRPLVIYFLHDKKRFECRFKPT